MARLSPSIIVALAACATPPPPAPVTDPPAPAVIAEPPEAVPALRLPSDVRPTRYTLTMSIDPDAPGFSGTARIELTLDRPRKVLWLHGLDLEMDSASVEVAGSARAATWSPVNDDGLARLEVETALPAGPATLVLRWHNAFDPRLVGLYVAAAEGRRYAFTQFEDIYARRAFPCFDEPGFKTPFDVTVEVPAEAVLIGNTMPVAETVEAGRRRVQLATTRPLPTYLVAWAVGPFDVVAGPAVPPSAVRTSPVPIRGVAPRGRGGELTQALGFASELLALQEQYFGVSYPFGKLDSVAVPDYAYGAMENAGAIHYLEALLLYTEGVSPRDLKVDSAETIAHEQAHQWFGDLVTMPWWDDAWLNESFATWFATRTLERWKPEWNAGRRLQRAAASAMNNDSLASARAIRKPVTSVKNIMDQFDVLTYEKGGAVLGMFERYLGEEVFRQGISRYIAEHADGSGSTEDLLSALSTTSGQDVGPAFRSFLDQPGVPLIKARVSCDPAPTVTLEQSRFIPIGVQATPQMTAQQWQVPVCLTWAAEKGKPTSTCTLLAERSSTVTLPACPAWVMPNAGAAGYYRWSMPAEDLRRLMARRLKDLTAAERMSVAEAMRAGVQSGALSAADALASQDVIAADPDPDVARATLPLVWLTRGHLVAAADRPAVDAVVRRLYGPVVARLGLKARAGESESTRQLRNSVIAAVAHASDPRLVAELTRIARAYLGGKDGPLNPRAADPDLAKLAVEAAIEHGDVAVFDAALARLKQLEDAGLREALLSGLSSARDPTLARRALELTTSGALRKQETAYVLFGQASDERTRQGAWDFLRANADAVIASMPPTHAAFLPAMTEGFCDDLHGAEVRAFFEPRVPANPGMQLALAQAVEAISVCSALVAAQRDSATAFIRSRAGAPPVGAPPGR